MGAPGTTQRMIVDLHHTKRDAGRNYGFILESGNIVPLAAVTLGVEGMPEDEGRANAHQFAASGALYDALQEMWDTSCTNATSTPSKAAFLKAHAALALARGEKPC